MSDYLHGAYGDSNANGNRVSVDSQSAIVVFGTAPVQTFEIPSGGTYNVNKAVLVHNIAEAKKYFGYSTDWAKYTLCEAMHHFFETVGVGPLVMVNVLDPTKAAHKNSTATTASKTPAGGVITIADAEDAILDSIVVQTQDSTPVTKEKGTDYTVIYNASKQTITIKELTAGALGTAALTITYNTVKPSGVEATDLIGTTDNLGGNTGLYCVKDVYGLTGMVPAYLMAPGWSEIPTVNAAMHTVSQKINGHWDAWVFADLPLIDNATPITMATAATYKAANGYTYDNETVYFPMVTGTDNKNYHLSVIAAANFQALLGENEGIPYHSASNTDAPIISSLYLGATAVKKVYDDEIINENLNKNGICSAAFVGGRWAVWGAHAASYNQSDATDVNVTETALMMLYYLSNDFQIRRPANVDKPMTANDIASIVAEEQQRLDALIEMGALIYGQAMIDSEAIQESDVYSNDYAFEFRVTTTPLCKSLTATVKWVDDGFATYYATDNSSVA